MTILNAENAALFNAAVANEIGRLGEEPILPWPEVFPGQEVKVGKFGVMIVVSPEKTLDILGSTLFAGGLLDTLDGIVNRKTGKKK